MQGRAEENGEASMGVSGVCYWEQLPGQNYHSCVKHMKKINNWMEAGVLLLSPSTPFPHMTARPSTTPPQADTAPHPPSSPSASPSSSMGGCPSLPSPVDTDDEGPVMYLWEGQCPYLSCLQWPCPPALHSPALLSKHQSEYKTLVVPSPFHLVHHLTLPTLSKPSTTNWTHSVSTLVPSCMWTTKPWRPLG